MPAGLRRGALPASFGSGRGYRFGVRVGFYATLLGLLAVVTVAVAGAYRAHSARAWNAVALFAGGGVVCAYGLLARLLCAAGPSCSTTRSGVAIVAGAGVAALGLVVLTRDVTRR
jgi:hypothetical protein